MIDKAHILSEIERTAKDNGGKALGKQRFVKETGIPDSAWCGRFWTKWSDALAEAGFEKNNYVRAFGQAHLLENLAAFVAELGRFPVMAELRMKAHSEKGFPSHSAWSRIGPKEHWPQRLQEYCGTRPELHHLIDLCQQAIPQSAATAEILDTNAPASIIGYVYLIKFRSDFKIGASSDPERRYGQIATQMPDAMTNVHTIKTDDPFGVESYWHRRFEAKRLKGEWFRLTQADVRAFRRWKSIF